MTQTGPTPPGPRSRWRWWLLGMCVLLAFAGLITATTLLLDRQRENQRYDAAMAALRNAGLPTSRQEFLATLPPPPPDEQNLALPFIEAAKAINRESPLWEAFDNLREFPPPESHAASMKLDAAEVVEALEALKANPPEDPLADIEVNMTPEVRQQLEALAALAALEVDPSRLDPPLQWALIRAVLEENEQAIAAVEAVLTDLPVDPMSADFGVPWRDTSITMLELDLDHLQSQRELALLLRAAALHAAAEGDTVEAIERVARIHLQSRAVSAAARIMVESLVGNSIDFLAAGTLRQIAPELTIESEVEQQAARRLMALLLDESDVDAKRLRQAWVGEVVLEIESLRHLANDARPILGASDAGPVSQREIRKNVAFLANFFSTVMPVLEAETRADAEEMLPSQELVQQQLEDEKLRLASLFVPSIERFLLATFERRAERRLAAAGLAVKLYQTDHDGQLPPSLEALVPEYLPHVPRDPTAADAPIRYDPDRGRLWTVGRNQKDDNGRSMEDAQREEPDVSTSKLYEQIDTVLMLR